MRLAAHLYRLQQVDADLDALRDRMTALRWDLEHDPRLEAALRQWETADQAWRAAEDALRQAEAESARVRAKLRREENRLYSGEVRNPKELQALQQEVHSLRRRLDQLEDRAVALLLAAEEAEAARGAARQALEQAQAAWEARRARGLEELARLEVQQRTLETQRARLWDSLPAEARVVYVDLRARRRGVAVAGVREGSCLACGATLSTAVLQQVRTTETWVHCPSCGRILYALD